MSDRSTAGGSSNRCSLRLSHRLYTAITTQRDATIDLYRSVDRYYQTADRLTLTGWACDGVGGWLARRPVTVTVGLHYMDRFYAHARCKVNDYHLLYTVYTAHIQYTAECSVSRHFNFAYWSSHACLP